MVMHIDRTLLGVSIGLIGGGAGRSRAMGGDRRRRHRPTDSGSSNHAAATPDRPGPACAGAAGSAVDDRRSRYGAVAWRDPAQLSANELDATGERIARRRRYPGLASDVRSAINANAVLSPAQLATLSPADQQQISRARQTAALRQALAQEALANTSGRFAAIQS